MLSVRLCHAEGTAAPGLHHHLHVLAEACYNHAADADAQPESQALPGGPSAEAPDPDPEPDPAGPQVCSLATVQLFHERS